MDYDSNKNNLIQTHANNHKLLVSVVDLIPDINSEYKTNTPFMSVGNYYVDPSIELLYQLTQTDTKVEQALSRFKNHIVIDIGAGIWWRPYLLICKGGARGYVGVEKFGAHQLHTSLSYMFQNLADLKTGLTTSDLIPATVVSEDMLAFLKSVPDASVCVFSSGIDKSVISDKQYKIAVGKEIERVVSPTGVYFSYENPFPVPALTKHFKYKDIYIYTP